MGLFGGDDMKGIRAAEGANFANREMFNKIKEPTYEQYNPELYGMDSANYQLNEDDPVAKSAQMSALAKMAGLADTGLSPEDEAGYFKARQIGTQMAHAGTESALQNAQARGVAGGGMEFAMREMANQAGAQKAQEAALQQASDAARQKALYNQAYLTGTSQMRDQDYRTNAANTNIVNQFNQANTSARNQTANSNVDLRNNAFQYNQGLKDKDFSNQMTKANSMAGINNRAGEIGAAEAEAEQKKRAALGSAVGAIGGGIMGGPAGASMGAGIGGAMA
jgi:hypothetical protein